MFTLSTLKYYCATLCALVVAVTMADTPRCKPNFKYHASTHTCLQLSEHPNFFGSAKYHCKTLRDGPSDTPGHLVYIFDNDTDQFVRDLLPNEMVNAFIGLETVWLGGKLNIFAWGENQEHAGYFGWEGQTQAAEHRAVVTVSKKGWNKVGDNTMNRFICQVKSEIKLPDIAMTCPLLLMGQPSPEIQCAIGKGFAVAESKFRINDMRAICSMTDCVATEGYRVSVEDTDQSLSMTLNIMAAKRSDAGLLTCEWELAEYANKLKASCLLRIYDPPTSPPELMKLPSKEAYKVGDIINITCTVNGGSPLVNSTTIRCDPEIRDTSSESKERHVVIEIGNTANMHVIITGEMNGKTCNCSAIHESQLYNLQSSLALSVKVVAKITEITFQGAVDKGDFWELDAMKELSFTCTASGNPVPSLSLYYTDDKNLLYTVTGYELSYTKRVSCNDSGTYICVASNIDNEEPHVLQESLRVRCRPTLCSTEEKNLKYSVILNNDATIKMCVHAYPTPSGLIPYKGSYPVSNRNYSVEFDYTDEVRCRGLINLKLNDVLQEDMGQYSLWMGTDFLPFTFSFVPQGPPECPKEIKVKDVFSNMITISWKPGHDGGLQQTFIVLRRDVIKEVGRVQDAKSAVMEYNVTGLSAMTSYIISMDVVNELGRTNCSNINVTAMTNTPCENKWGDKCENTCSENCVNKSCNKDNGSCQCKEGYTGDKCETNMCTSDLLTGVGIGVGGTIGLVLFIVSAVLIFRVQKVRQRKALGDYNLPSRAQHSDYPYELPVSERSAPPTVKREEGVYETINS